MKLNKEFDLTMNLFAKIIFFFFTVMWIKSLPES